MEQQHTINKTGALFVRQSGAVWCGVAEANQCCCLSMAFSACKAQPKLASTLAARLAIK